MGSSPTGGTSMKKIFLTDGKITLVNEEDFLFLVGYNWRLSATGYVVCSNGYVDNLNNKYLHKIIAKRMNLDLSNEIDHIDRDRLNNQRNNLRPATSSQNSANSKANVRNTSGYKGVHWRKERRKWQAKIQVEGERIYLGNFDTPEEASEAYNQAADYYFGEFANY